MGITMRHKAKRTYHKPGKKTIATKKFVQETVDKKKQREREKKWRSKTQNVLSIHARIPEMTIKYSVMKTFFSGKYLIKPQIIHTTIYRSNSKLLEKLN